MCVPECTVNLPFSLLYAQVKSVERLVYKNELIQVAKQNKHCVLNVGIHSIDRLHSVDLFPIVIFVKFKSAQDIRFLIYCRIISY